MISRDELLNLLKNTTLDRTEILLNTVIVITQNNRIHIVVNANMGIIVNGEIVLNSTKNFELYSQVHELFFQIATFQKFGKQLKINHSIKT